MYNGNKTVVETLNEENGKENASFDVHDFTTPHKHLSKGKKKRFRFSTVTGMLTFWLFKVPTIKTTDNMRRMIT